MQPRVKKMANEVFLDTAYLIALSSLDDQLHPQAQLLRRQIRASRRRLVTTRAVLLEVGNALSGLRFRRGAVRLLEAFEADPNVEIIPLTEELYARAFALYRTRPDKEWGMVDCISFVVMQERGITDSLTIDHHFEQAGSVPLLKS